MTVFSHYELQKSLYETLTGDSALMNLVGGIYDRVPDDADFPYVTLGEMRGRDWSCKTFSGMQYDIQIHVWSREGGRKECAQSMERIHALLHEQSPAVEGQECIVLRFVSSDIQLENDGWNYHGHMQFIALLAAV